MVELRYRRGDATADEILAVVQETLADLADPTGDVAAAARAAGLDRADLAEVNVEVREDAQGLEPILTSIIVGITVRAGTQVAEGLWTKVIWPRVRRRLGSRALLDRESGPEEPGR